MSRVFFKNINKHSSIKLVFRKNNKGQCLSFITATKIDPTGLDTKNKCEILYEK